jgi:hypothetical protein
MILTHDFLNDADYTKVNTKIDAGKGKLSFVDLPGQNFTEDFADDTDFIYDAAKAEFSAGKLQQKINAITESYLQNFTSDSGFTYNSALVEFASGLARQKNQRPTDTTFGATYTNSINGSWGNGVLTGTPTGIIPTPTGTLDLRGSTVKFVTYPAAGNVPNLQIGCFRFKYKPNYSGAPATDKYLLSQYDIGAVTTNSLELWHINSGALRLNIYDSANNIIFAGACGAWSPVSGTEYQMELNFNFSTSQTRLFVENKSNGQMEQLGSTITGTGTRSAVNFLNIGSGRQGTQTADGEFSDLEIFSTVQHTTNHAAGYILPEKDYIETIVQCPIQSYLYNIASLGAPTITSINAPKYIVNGYYWNGAAWAASSNTYATAMTAAAWIANIATFPGAQLGNGVTVKVVFQDSNILGSIDSIAFTINENHYVTNAVILPEMEHTGLGLIQALTNLVVVSQGSERYSLQIERSGNYLYWNGNAWTVSDGSYAQANDLATFLANKATLPVLNKTYGQFKIHFTDSNTQGYVDNLIVTMTLQQYASIGSFETLNYFDASAISSIVGSITESGSNKVYFVVKAGNDYLYHDGANWVASDKSIVQSNTLAELSAEIDSLLEENKRIKFYIILDSEDGTETPLIDYLTITYVFGGLEPAEGNMALVYGYVKDLEENPINAATVTIEVNIGANEYCEAANKMMSKKIIKTTNDDGYWFAYLPWSSEFDSLGSINYKIKIEKAGVISLIQKDGEDIEFSIPDDTDELNLTSRISMAS